MPPSMVVTQWLQDHLHGSTWVDNERAMKWSIPNLPYKSERCFLGVWKGSTRLEDIILNDQQYHAQGKIANQLLLMGTGAI